MLPNLGCILYAGNCMILFVPIAAPCFAGRLCGRSNGPGQESYYESRLVRCMCLFESKVLGAVWLAERMRLDNCRVLH